MLSADQIASRLEPRNPDAASLDARHWVEKKRSQLLNEGQSFCYETVFSHSSKIDFVAEAKAFGYEVMLTYIHLETSELNQARVKQRVSEGGHDVPAEKIVSRIPRTMNNIANTLCLVNEAWLLDNSSRTQPFKTIAFIREGALSCRVHPMPIWATEIISSFERNPAY